MSLPSHSPAQTSSPPASMESGALQTRVRLRLAAVIHEHRDAAGEYSTATQTLWSRIELALEGGKLTRPRLVLLGHEAFAARTEQGTAAEDGMERVIQMGCAFELLHGSLLMHDDVIDRDFTRRGRPTLSALYRDDALARGKSAQDAEHAGHSAAIIAGDLLLAAAIKLARRAADSLPAADAIENSFHQGIHHAGAGELEDLLFSLDPVPAQVHEVLRMEKLKTAAYSFQVPLQTGALLAGADAAEATALANIGSQLGVAYQLIDDILGTFGDPEQTGKSIESDLREGKSTILTAMAAATPGFAAHLQLFRDPDANVPAMRSALEATGAERFARQLAQDLCAGATSASRTLNLPARVSSELEGFADLILNRGA
jgi:geranylgeranyl pyrophosphate synthase